MKNALNFYDNQLVTANEKKPIYAPFDGQQIGEVSYFDPQQLDMIVAKMLIAQKQWANLTLKKRSEVLYNYRHLLVLHQKVLAQLISLENGKSIKEAQAEVAKAIEQVELACAMPNCINDEIQQVSSNVTCQVRHAPVGLLASITPFNFPIMVPHWSIPNALVLGNGLLLKPSPLTPLTPNFFAQLWAQAGLPKNLLVVLNGEEALCDALIQHPMIGGVSFVGSTNIAKAVYQKAACHYKRVLALGSAKNFLVILPDYNQKTTCKEIIASGLGMSGQRCMAASVIVLVGECSALKAELKQALAAKAASCDLPPLITKAAVDKLQAYVQNAQQLGAQVLLDGSQTPPNSNGYFCSPILLDWGQNIQKMPYDEAFGPLLEIVQVPDVASAITFQNQSPYGNGASVFTKSGYWGYYVAQNLQAGMVGINVGVPIPREPFSFGGMKWSKFGHGDLTGKASIDFYTHLVKLTVRWEEDLV